METRKWGTTGGFDPVKRNQELDEMLASWDFALEENAKFILDLRARVNGTA